MSKRKQSIRSSERSRRRLHEIVGSPLGDDAVDIPPCTVRLRRVKDLIKSGIGERKIPAGEKIRNMRSTPVRSAAVGGSIPSTERSLRNDFVSPSRVSSLTREKADPRDSSVKKAQSSPPLNFLDQGQSDRVGEPQVDDLDGNPSLAKGGIQVESAMNELMSSFEKISQEMRSLIREKEHGAVELIEMRRVAAAQMTAAREVQTQLRQKIQVADSSLSRLKEDLATARKKREEKEEEASRAEEDLKRLDKDKEQTTANLQRLIEEKDKAIAEVVAMSRKNLNRLCSILAKNSDYVDE